MNNFTFGSTVCWAFHNILFPQGKSKAGPPCETARSSDEDCLNSRKPRTGVGRLTPLGLGVVRALLPLILYNSSERIEVILALRIESRERLETWRNAPPAPVQDRNSGSRGGGLIRQRTSGATPIIVIRYQLPGTRILPSNNIHRAHTLFNYERRNEQNGNMLPTLLPNNEIENVIQAPRARASADIIVHAPRRSEASPLSC